MTTTPSPSSPTPVDVEAIRQRTKLASVNLAISDSTEDDIYALLSSHTRQSEELAAARARGDRLQSAYDVLATECSTCESMAELTALRASVERLTRMGVHERPDGIAEGYWYCGFCEAAWRGEREDRSHHYGPQDGFDGCPLAVTPARLVSEAGPTPTEGSDDGE